MHEWSSNNILRPVVSWKKLKTSVSLYLFITLTFAMASWLTVRLKM